jgi:hypothetical protein
METVPVLKFKTPARPAAFKVDSQGTLFIENISYASPDRASDREAYAAWMELIEGVQSATELARLARALAS